MALVILRAAERAVADGVPLTDRLDDIAQGRDQWRRGAREARDVGARGRRNALRV